MCLFKRKNAADKAKENRELIAANSNAVDGLIVLAGTNDELIAELKDLKEKLKYLIPSDNVKVVDYDKQIKNMLGDLRIALTKADGEVSKKAKDLIRDIKLAAADRSTKL